MLDRNVSSPVDPYEAAQPEAELKAAALLELQWSNGAGAAVWAHAAQDALALNESVNERLATDDEDPRAWQRLHASALMVVVAIDQVRVYERCVRRLTGDAELAHARDRFNEACGDYLDGEEMVGGDLLSLDAHLDKYAVGDGSHETGREQPPLFSDAIV